MISSWKKYSLGFFKKMVPTISATEKIALRCGTLSLDRHLFENKVPLVLKNYKVHLTELEKIFLDKETSMLCQLRKNKEEKVTEEEMNYVRQKGFLGLCLPESSGGKGFSSYAHSRVVEKIASHCISSAVTVMVPNSLGPGELLVKYGTTEQKKKYLRKLATGEMLPCFGLTGPQNGSDALGQLDRGSLVESGTMIEFECNKRWITLAPIADLVGLAIHVEGFGVTLLLLERESVPWLIGDRHYPVGATFMNGTIKTKGPVRVPVETIIGGKENIGKGWEMLMECLSEGRGISLPALSVGVGCMLSIKTSYYAKARKQFGISLYQMQGVQEKLGRMIANTYTSLAMHELFNATLLKGEKSSVLSAILKYRATEMGRETILHGMDIFAGKGITMGPRNPIASFYTQIPIAITVEGSNTLTRSLIVFAQGINKSHPYVGGLIEALETENADAFFRLLPKMVLYTLDHYRRSFSPSVDKKAILESRNSLFILVSSLLLLKGKGLKKDQMQTGRMADVFSDLYAAYSLLWFQKDKELESLLLQHLLARMDTNLGKVCEEEGIYFLLGPMWKTRDLSDKQWIQLSQTVLNNPTIDNLFSEYVYVDKKDAIFQYREFLQQKKTPPPELVNEIIQVDSFPNQ